MIFDFIQAELVDILSSGPSFTFDIEAKLKTKPGWRFANKEEMGLYVKSVDPLYYINHGCHFILVALGDSKSLKCWTYSVKRNRYYEKFRLDYWWRHHLFLIVHE